MTKKANTTQESTTSKTSIYDKFSYCKGGIDVPIEEKLQALVQAADYFVDRGNQTKNDVGFENFMMFAAILRMVAEDLRKRHNADIILDCYRKSVKMISKSDEVDKVQEALNEI